MVSVDPVNAGHTISDTGLLTISGLGAGELATVRIKAAQPGYVDGFADLPQYALTAPKTPSFVDKAPQPPTASPSRLTTTQPTTGSIGRSERSLRQMRTLTSTV